jgi:hypothetical protein
MIKVAYSLGEAAVAASVSDHAIKAAIKAGALIARQLGETIIVSHIDLIDWVQSFPPLS